MPTDIVNADEQTEDSPPAETPEEDAIKAHPDYQELERKYAAVRKGMDESNLTKKQLQAEIAKYKTLAGVEDEQIEEEAQEEKPLTRAELEEKLWQMQHAKDVEIYADDEYEEDIEAGIPKDKALKYAKLRAQANPDKARLERQKLVAQGSSASTRDLGSTDITEKDRENMVKWGYSEEAVKRQKQLKKERGQL